MIDTDKIKSIVEASLLAADQPLTSEQLVKLFVRGEMPRAEVRELVKAALDELEGDSRDRGVELKRVASGYRMQVKQDLSPWVSRLWDEKPPRYSRALLETLALVAYRQPVTRGDIEQVRGVAVSQNIMRTLTERGWVKVVGQREVPGRPSMYGTTKEFLDYFNLKSLSELPPLSEIRELIEPVIVEEVAPPQAELKLVDDDGEAPADAEGQDGTDDEAAAVFAPEPDGDADAQALADGLDGAEDNEAESAEPEDAELADASQDSVAGVDFAEDEAAATQEQEVASAADPEDAAEEATASADEGEDEGEGPVSAEVVQLPRAPRG